MSRRKARELTLQILFQEDLTRSDPEEVKRLFWESQPDAGSARTFAEELFQRVIDNEELIDELIRRHARHWRPERMAAVDRNVLRMAIAEFLFMATPKVVVIDEAVEIARKFGTEKSPEFVNGILDAIREELERSPV